MRAFCGYNRRGAAGRLRLCPCGRALVKQRLVGLPARPHSLRVRLILLALAPVWVQMLDHHVLCEPRHAARACELPDLRLDEIVVIALVEDDALLSEHAARILD